VDPSVSRTTWQTLEPFHSMVYFAPEPQEEFAAIGLVVGGRVAAGYFPPRAAAMGAVSAGVVQATFFNFSRRAVDAGMVGAWERAAPPTVLAARYRGADRALRRLCAGLIDGPEVAQAGELAREACRACTPYGRPLYAAHADLEWPDLPHLALWHAIMLLREFRGDGHIAALTAQALTGLEAAVTHIAQGDRWTKDALRTTRGYSVEEWQACVDDLEARGWLDDAEQFTATGRARRKLIEDTTDVLALPPWDRIGEDGCARLRDLVRPLTEMITVNGGYPLGA